MGYSPPPPPGYKGDWYVYDWYLILKTIWVIGVAVAIVWYYMGR